MTKILKYSLIGITLLGCIYVLLLFFILRNTKSDVSQQEPYLELINQPLITVNAAILIDNSTMTNEKEYLKELQSADNIDTTRVNYISVPIGSVFKVHKALHIKRSVSGGAYAVLLGEVELKATNKNYSVLYTWGHFKTICLDDPCDYWAYDQAPWQVD